MIKKIINVFIITLVVSCQTTTTNKQHNSKYDILISYNYCKNDKTYNREYLDNEYLRDGNLYLIFETNFDNDTLIYKLNREKEKTEIISTEPSTGVAKEIKIENIESINTVGIRINNGKEAVLEIDTMNFFLITFSDTLLKVRVPKSVPTYE